MHKRRVYSLCLRMTGDPRAAEDLSQKAFLNAFRRISTYQSESALAKSLYRLVVKIALTYLRERPSQKESP
jgi:RNA polymerase sigma-70 factor, ECF subfamily